MLLLDIEFPNQRLTGLVEMANLACDRPDEGIIVWREMVNGAFGLPRKLGCLFSIHSFVLVGCVMCLFFLGGGGCVR